MKYIKHILVGMVFGVVLIKAELISWFRWQEMFLFDNFQLYGVVASTVFFGALGVFMIKKFKWTDISGNPIRFADKDRRFYRYALGGLIFGFGWAMAGCPGAHYALIGHGFAAVVLILLSAVAGTFAYGLIRHRLPH